MKRESIVSNLAAKIIALIMVLIVVIIFFFGYSYALLRRDLTDMLQSFVRVNGVRIEDSLEHMTEVASSLIYGNDNYEIVREGTEAEQVYALMNLRAMAIQMTVYNSDFDMLVIGEGITQHSIFVNPGEVPVKDALELRNRVMESAVAAERGSGWEIVGIDGNEYIGRIYSWGSNAIGIYASAKKLLAGLGEGMELPVAVTVCSSDGKNTKIYGSGTEEISGAGSGNIVSEYGLGDSGLALRAQIPGTALYTRVKPGLVLMAGVLILAVVLFFLFAHYLREVVIRPMASIQEQIALIGKGEKSQISESYKTEEFEALRRAVNTLLNQVMQLKIEAYEEKIALSESELRAIRLQLRPHFFLNALTTISSLSFQHKNDEIRQYIDALSLNVRYMFRAGLHTVPLAEEIRYVENYFSMQEMKYPDCVFHYIDMEPGTEQWMVPQMIIHTIVENEYKYAVSVDRMLTVLIRICTKKREGEACLYIEIEDNGGGYPDEVIAAIADPGAESINGNYQRGLISLKRMMKLMYGRDGLFCIHNVEPHGGCAEFTVPLRPVNEIPEGK